MRLCSTIPLLGCVLAGAIISSPALADWQNPYVYRQSSGSWTNVEYNDGTCHYYYSHNAYDNTTNLNKYGDCSQIAIGPDGQAMRVVAAPAYGAPAYGATPVYGAAPAYDAAPVYATPVPAR